jgi:hypothetical protein
MCKLVMFILPLPILVSYRFNVYRLFDRDAKHNVAQPNSPSTIEGNQMSGSGTGPIESSIVSYRSRREIFIVNIMVIF